MARQSGDLRIIGTVDDLSFYRMRGDYFVRVKSSLSPERFWRDAVFERSRRSSERFGEGNKLASRIYRSIEKEKQVYKLFCYLKKRAIRLIKEGKNLLEATDVLIDDLKGFGVYILGAAKKNNSLLVAGISKSTEYRLCLRQEQKVRNILECYPFKKYKGPVKKGIYGTTELLE